MIVVQNLLKSYLAVKNNVIKIIILSRSLNEWTRSSMIRFYNIYNSELTLVETDTQMQL